MTPASLHLSAALQPPASLQPALVPVLPDSAPFTPAQRAWLNGFFAGLLGLDAPAGDSRQPPGTSPQPAASEEECFPWHDSSLPMEERLRLAEGKPLARVLMAAMAQLDCGACGYLCRTYSEAIARGEEKSLTRCAPGGKATARKLKELLAAGPGIGERGAGAGTKSARGASPYGRKNPFAARVVKSVRLNREGSAKETRFVVLDLEGSGITYEPGDALGVYPENCPELVGEVIRALAARGEEEVPAPGARLPLREALARHYDLRSPTDELFAVLRRAAAGQDGAARLEELERAAEEGAEAGPQVIDLLEACPEMKLGPAEFVSTLEPLEPRLYSISSSLKAHPDEVHLTVGVVRYEARGRTRKGVASTFLAERIEPGQRVPVFVHTSSFRIPICDDAPAIMIGPGTGIAPFRAFLEERRARGARGRNWLFFGDQRRAHDFLFAEELEAFRREGLLTRLDTAFSRDQPEKVYVQHRLLENSRELWGWLEEGAHLYVCGDAKRMAADVDRALGRVVAAEGKKSEAGARDYLGSLTRARRYQRDVY